MGVRYQQRRGNASLNIMKFYRLLIFLLTVNAILVFLLSCVDAKDSELDKEIFDSIIENIQNGSDKENADEDIGKDDSSKVENSEDTKTSKADDGSEFSIFFVTKEYQDFELSELIDLLTEIRSAPSIAVFCGLSDRDKTHIAYNIGEPISLNDDIAVYVDASHFLCEPTDIALIEEQGVLLLDVSRISGGRGFSLALTLDGYRQLKDNCKIYSSSEEIQISEYEARSSDSGKVLWERVKFKIY